MDVTMYKCAECSKSYKKFYSLKLHILSIHSKNVAPRVEIANNPQVTIYKCHICNSLYSNKYSLNRHIRSNICSKHGLHNDIMQYSDSKTNSSPSEAMFLKLTDVLAKLVEDRQPKNTNFGVVSNGNHNNITMVDHIDNTENNITQNNITQNNNNALYIQEIHINPMGKENLSHLSDATILQILSQGINAVPALAKAIMELPENCNIVESDKRNRKATVVNRNGDVEIMDLNKALTMSATDTVDRVDDFYEKFKDELPKKDKSIMRMARAHGLDSDEESEDEIPKDETFEAYFKKYMSKIKDTIDVNKKPIHDRINKYKEHKYKEKTAINKQNMMALSTVHPTSIAKV